MSKNCAKLTDEHSLVVDISWKLEQLLSVKNMLSPVEEATSAFVKDMFKVVFLELFLILHVCL